MEIDDIKEVILDQRQQLDDLRKRENIIERAGINAAKFLAYPNILVILGVRRCGKSTLSFQLFSGQKFGYINFDDDRLNSIKAADLNKILQAFYELYGTDIENIILDEVQEVDAWQKFASRLRLDKKVIVTGSNSEILSGELATSLTGRHIDITLFPFSFEELLIYKGINYKGTLTTKEKALLSNAMEDYLYNGGFPERLKFGKELLRQIYNDIITKDIVKRHRIKNESNLRGVSTFLMSNISKEFSYSSIIKATSVKNVLTVSKWISYLEDAYLFFKLNRFSFKLKETVFAPKKIYAIDTGLSNSLSLNLSERFGQLIENAVAIELFRRRAEEHNKYDLFYWKDHQQREVDFIVKESSKVSQLIQVTYASPNDEIANRETRNLLTASKELHCNNLLIVTWGYEGTIQKENKIIKCIPLWKWLLNL